MALLILRSPGDQRPGLPSLDYKNLPLFPQLNGILNAIIALSTPQTSLCSIIMSNIPFNAPAYAASDLTHISDPLHLRAAVANQIANFAHFTTNTLIPAQLAWARQILANPDANDVAHEQANYTIAHQKVAFAPYELNNNRRDIIHLLDDPLFTYMSPQRVEEHLQNGGLRVSYGAEVLAKHQKGEFPRGAYGTPIAPWTQSVGTKVMARFFFDTEYSLPSHDNARAPIDTSRWIVFCRTTGMSPKGELHFPRFHGSSQDFKHYALATPNHQSGDYVRFYIVAHGKTLIPPETQEWEALRANSDDEGGVPVRDEQLNPVSATVGGVTNVPKIVREI
ncbi:RolB family protein [Ensifer sp. YR511]|uniref:RolB family protein n=1 Tax=Ensifer sp. YR511 TaxID=1855294 RepID=UPI0015A026A7|nr:RolB family protein [Ensifer sp. YR511]